MKTTHRIAAGSAIAAAALLAAGSSASAHGAAIRCIDGAVDLLATDYQGATATITKDGVVVSTNVFEHRLHLVWDGPLAAHVYAVTIVADDGWPTFHDTAGPCIEEEEPPPTTVTVPETTAPTTTVPEEEPPPTTEDHAPPTGPSSVGPTRAIPETETPKTPVTVELEPIAEQQPVAEPVGEVDDTAPAPTSTAVAAARSAELPATGNAEIIAVLAVAATAAVVIGFGLLVFVNRKRPSR